MVDFNPDWLADFTGATKLGTDFLNKPTGLDGHHVGTKSNIANHPDLNVQRLLIELGTRVEAYTGANGQKAYRAFYDTGNSADNFIGLPSSGTNGVAGGQPVHFDNHAAATAFSQHVDSEALEAYKIARTPVAQGGLGLDHASAIGKARDIKVGYGNAEKMLLLGAYQNQGFTGSLDQLYSNPTQPA